MKLEFNESDLDQAKRLNAKLDRLPRFRMQTTVGRLTLNALLWLAELLLLFRRREGAPRMEPQTAPSPRGRTKLRVFRPPGRSAGVILHFHGGGWTIGNARMSDAQNAELAARLDVTVVAVDYHLAVFRSLDELIEECAAVGAWALDCARTEFGSDRIIFWGSSAGAHLAAAALLRLRDRHRDFEKIRGVVLLYGLYDLSGTDMVRNADSSTLILHGPTVRTTLKKLTPDMSDAERRNGDLSPLFADLIGLPPALFLVGERDMLLEDSRRMAQAWDDENANALLVVAPESPHAFGRLNTAIAQKIMAFADAWIVERQDLQHRVTGLRRASDDDGQRREASFIRTAGSKSSASSVRR